MNLALGNKMKFHFREPEPNSLNLQSFFRDLFHFREPFIHSVPIQFP